MANPLATHSLSDPRLHWLDLDVRAAAQSRSSLLINGERDEALLVARLAHEVGVTYCTTSHFVVVGPDVLSEGLSHFPMASSSPERRGRQSRASEERWTLCVEDIDQLPPLGQERLMGFLDVVCASEGARHALWVIATATTTLETRVASKDFLRELYYRLNVVHVLLSDARTASPSALDYLTTEVGKRLGEIPPSFRHTACTSYSRPSGSTTPPSCNRYWRPSNPSTVHVLMTYPGLSICHTCKTVPVRVWNNSTAAAPELQIVRWAE